MLDAEFKSTHRNNSGGSQWVDGRVISLYARNTSQISTMPGEKHDFYMFEYYSALDVMKVPLGSPLLNAYECSHNDKNQMLRQVLLAFTDILETDAGEEQWGFTKEEIERFWANKDEPILFCTLLNVESSDKLKQVVQRIKDIYTKGKYLIYFTYDYCEAVIFLRGHSFQECANLVFKLDFGQDVKEAEQSSSLLVDSITLYSFESDYDFDSEKFQTEEYFPAYLRFGVRNADRMKLFFNKLYDWTKEKRDVEISKNWILGRYDIGIYNPCANLEWINKAMQMADECDECDENKHWYTTSDLSVLIQPDEKLQLHGEVSFQNSDCKALKKRMENYCDDFEIAYRRACNNAGVTADEVWLRWLREASEQSVSFLESNMTLDLGTCLVPQFLDFLKYVNRLFDKKGIPLDNNSQTMECFRSFSANISVLIDSLNHSSRQFILTPPFRTVAFEMPPKVMAYYIAVTHSLIEVLRDEDKETVYYGFTISPKFVKNLDVRSLAQQKFTKEDQFLSIGISEESMYRIQSTTAILAHEISHFVGERTRKRYERKRCVLRAELYTMVLDVAVELYNTLVERCMEVKWGMSGDLFPPIPEKDAVYIEWSSLTEKVDELLTLLGKRKPKYISEKKKDCYKRELLDLLQEMPYHIYNDITLSNRLFDFLWDTLIANEDGITALGRVICVLLLYYNEKKLPKDKQQTLMDSSNKQVLQVLNVYGKVQIREIYLRVLLDYARNYGKADEGRQPHFKETCDLFSEAFADLQAICLFQLGWNEYCELFNSQLNVLPDTTKQRLIAIAAAHYLQDGGKNGSVATGNQIQAFQECMNLAKDVYNIGKVITNQELGKAGVDPAQIYYLTQYLSYCDETINNYFNTKPDEVNRLLNTYRNFSDENGICNVFKNLMEQVENYRDKIQSQC